MVSVYQRQWSVFSPYLTWSLISTGHCSLLTLLHTFSPVAFCDTSLTLVFFSFSSLLLGLLWSLLFLNLGLSCQLYLYSLLRWASLIFWLQKPLRAYNCKIHVFSPDLALLSTSYLLAVSTWMVGWKPSICPSISILHPSPPWWDPHVLHHMATSIWVQVVGST